MLDIWTAVDDIETQDSLLTYTFSATADKLILAYNSNTGFLNISAKDSPLESTPMVCPPSNIKGYPIKGISQ